MSVNYLGAEILRIFENCIDQLPSIWIFLKLVQYALRIFLL